MNPFVTIPRESLAELLRNSGSTLTPEEYVASLNEVQSDSAYRKYRSRAWVAAMSKYTLIVIAAAAIAFAGFDLIYAAYTFISGSRAESGFSPENILVAIGLVAVTFFEYRVHKYFRENDPRAPDLGFRNQSLFVVGILIYCLYHAFAPVAMSTDTQNAMSQAGVDMGMVTAVSRGFYLLIAIVAGGSQFGLACYYRAAKVR